MDEFIGCTQQVPSSSYSMTVYSGGVRRPIASAVKASNLFLSAFPLSLLLSYNL